MVNYTPLHVHDQHSFLDGVSSSLDYMNRAKDLGITHVAQTNHATLSGHRPFQEAAKEAGIVPILGLEGYYSPTDRFDRRSKAKREDDTDVYNHLTLLAMNETGLNNLNKMSEIAWKEGYYHKPRMDFEVLSELHPDVIMLSGCMSGVLAKAIERGNTAGALAEAYRFKELFGDRFYVEVMPTNAPELNYALLEIADTAGIKPVMTGDCHYARKDELWIEESYLILSTGPKYDKTADISKSQKMDWIERYNYLYPDRTMTFQEIEIYMRSKVENEELFQRQGITRQDIYENTNEIAQRIGTYPYHQGLDLLPKPEGDVNKMLRAAAYAGLKARGLHTNQEYIDRLERELKVIVDKDFSVYFIMVAEMLDWARSQGIMVGPGRGSSAGSLLCYCMRITEADPIKFGLLFERFLDPGRSDFPDVDADYQDTRRGEVVEHIRQKYGYVASIATFNTFKGKNCVKDASRALRIPLGDVNRALKNNDAPPSAYYFDIFDASEQGRAFTKKYPDAVKLAKALYGRIRGGGLHPAAVVVANQPISNFAPVETAKDPRGDTRIEYIANDMDQVADIGLIKFDVLGLKNLTIIKETLDDITLRTGKKFEMTDIPLDDAATYKMLDSGYTRGVFQAEGPTFRQWIMETKCDNFNDLVIGTSIARPGPKDTVGKVYQQRLKNPDGVWIDNHIEREIVKDTLGCVVYQEQVMLYMTEVAGMSMSDANKVRKIIGKKGSSSDFDAYREQFINGAAKQIPRARAKRLWEDFESFAGYAFNKSHAVVYSMVTYWTAWLKTHYPLEYMTALLRNETDKDTLTDYLIEAKRMGVTIRLPHVNYSEPRISIHGDAIALGLSSIKYISDNLAGRLIEARPFGSYNELETAVKTKGSGMNTRMLSALNAVGAAEFKDNPLRGTERDNLYEYLSIPAFSQKDIEPVVRAKLRPLEDYDDKGSFAIMGKVRKIVRGDGWARVDVVDETGAAGIFADQEIPVESGQMYVMLVSNNRIYKYLTSDELAEGVNSSLYKWLNERNPSVPEGMHRVIAFRSHKTKAGNRMAYMVLQSDMGQLENVMAFPQQYIMAYSKCHEGKIVNLQLAETDDGSLFVKEFNKDV